MKVAIYVRVSTEEQDFESQLKDCLSINKYGEYEVFEEKQSAWKDNKEREKFEQIKKLIKQEKIEHLICWDLDRLYRKRKKIVEFLEFCKVYNCNIHSFRQKWLEEIYKIPAPWGEIVSDMLIQVMGWMAEEESEKKSERVKLAVRREKGKPTKSYKGKKWGRKGLTKKTMNEVVELNKKGLSLREIADRIFYWDSNNNKKKISKSAVHKILKGDYIKK